MIKDFEALETQMHTVEGRQFNLQSNLQSTLQSNLQGNLIGGESLATMPPPPGTAAGHGQQTTHTPLDLSDRMAAEVFIALIVILLYVIIRGIIIVELIFLFLVPA